MATRSTQMRINPNYFTGKTKLVDISSRLGSGATKVYHVEFTGGAHTKLHRHTGAQILIASGGEGSLELYERTGGATVRFGIRRTKKTGLKTGSIAYIPPGVLHSHGAIRGRDFAHIAINLPSGRTASKTDWYESTGRTVTGRI